MYFLRHFPTSHLQSIPYFMPEPYGPKSLFSRGGNDWKISRYFINPTSAPENVKKVIDLVSLQNYVELGNVAHSEF